MGAYWIQPCFPFQTDWDSVELQEASKLCLKDLTIRFELTDRSRIMSNQQSRKLSSLLVNNEALFTASCLHQWYHGSCLLCKQWIKKKINK